MDPISIALGLARVVPSLVRWIGDDDAGAVAEKVVGIAETVTGQKGKSALEAIEKNPALALEFQKSVQVFELGKYQEETKRLEAINATMQAEAASADAYVRRMRPTFGYIMAATWFAQMMAVAYVIAFETDSVGRVLGSLSEMTAIWGIGLSVLGIYVYKRSNEKLGIQPGGVLSGLLGKKG